MNVKSRCWNTLAERGCIHNKSTFEATRTFPSGIVPRLFYYTSGLRPFHRPLDPDRVSEVVFDTLVAAQMPSRDGSDSYSLSRLCGLARIIAIRAQARELRERSPQVTGIDLDQFVCRRTDVEFEQVETNLVLEAVAAHLERTGVRREHALSVILQIIGYKVSEIAEAFGEKVETIRKRIQRSRKVVIAELRLQFAEVAA